MSKEINYTKLSEITVKSQGELDMIPDDFAGRIYVEFGTYFNKAVIRKRYYRSVVARENSSVVAWGNSSVEARGNSSVEAWENSSVEAWENSSVEARGNSSVVARENSSVEARENSSVEAWENSSVVARENSSVVARGNSSVEARGNSSVEAWENSSVVAWENSSVVAWGNSSVEARGNSSVEARGNSSVVARGNSSVVGSANAQIVDCLRGGKIEITSNARIVYNPKNIEDYLNFYGIKHNKKKCVMYKAVRKDGDRYFSDRDNCFEYEIGKIAKCVSLLDTDINNDCGSGIHIAHPDWCLRYGEDWDNLAILECEVDICGIVVPVGNPGKVRAAKVKILREIQLEECGVYGKILAKRRRKEAKN